MTRAPSTSSGRSDGGAGGPPGCGSAHASSGEGAWVGTLVEGRYAVRSLFAQGGEGAVYVGEDGATGRRVAIKCYLQHGRSPRPIPPSWEFDIVRRLEGPGVPRALSRGVHFGVPYMASEWIHGTPFPSPPGRRPASEIRDPAIRLLEVIERIHESGLVHRDIKPSNALVGPSGEVTLIDFARAYDVARPHDFRGPGGKGSTPYEAPEIRADRGPPSPRSDLFSVGVMLFEALAGRRPMSRRAWNLEAHRDWEPPAPRLRWVAPEVPRNWAEVVDRLLALDPAARPACAAEVRLALG